jgi:hypothetical protein
LSKGLLGCSAGWVKRVFDEKCKIIKKNF